MHTYIHSTSIGKCAYTRYLAGCLKLPALEKLSWEKLVGTEEKEGTFISHQGKYYLLGSGKTHSQRKQMEYTEKQKEYCGFFFYLGFQGWNFYSLSHSISPR
jgi:hypothetical protein